jgi:hypothetical protein
MTVVPVMFKCGRHSCQTSVQVDRKYVRIVQAFCPPAEHEISFTQHMSASLFQPGFDARIARALRDGHVLDQ